MWFPSPGFANFVQMMIMTTMTDIFVLFKDVHVTDCGVWDSLCDWRASSLYSLDSHQHSCYNESKNIWRFLMGLLLLLRCLKPL